MVNQGKIVKLTKGLYETDKTTPRYLVAGAIYGPSYLSFDFALSYYQLIPETVYTYTSATFKKKKKKQYTNDLGTFTYQDIPELVYPYEIQLLKEGDRYYYMATPEKALCDKLYSLKPVRSQKEMYKLLFEDLRIDVDEFEKLDINKINQLSDLYHCTNLKLLKKVKGNMHGNNYSTNDRNLSTSK